MSMKRRSFLKGTLASGAVGMAVGVGLLRPADVLAAYPDNAFAEKSLDGALKALLGSASAASGDINKHNTNKRQQIIPAPMMQTAAFSGSRKVLPKIVLTPATTADTSFVNRLIN